ncbi:Retrotransposable element Tf2 155 kDa protein type 2, partial [Glycine soja]
FTAILVVVDRFSKGVHLGALPTQFTAFKVASLFMDTVCKLHGFPRIMNRTVEQYLRSFVHHQPAEWYKFLALAEWSYNTSQHSGTVVTPFEATYGKPPPSIPSYVLGSSNNDAAVTVTQTRAEVHAKLQRKLIKAQATMKLFADKQRQDVQYEVGQLVYVKLRPYRQLSLRQGRPNKLAKCYFGPF